MHNRKYCTWISFMIDQLVRSYIVIGWICEEKNVIHQATYRKYIRSYIGWICKNLFVNPQVFYKSVFVVTLVAFVKKPHNVYGP